jgi:hypothetical protein
MSLTFNYTLGNAGWAKAKIAHQRRSCAMTISYLHDSLEELTASTNLLMQGVTEAKVLFMDEPGEHMMFLQIQNENILDIEIRWFDDWASWDLITDKKYKVVFKTQTNFLDFANEVLRNLEKIFRENGMEGYREKWGQSDFPLKGLEKLRELTKEKLNEIRK